MALDPRSSEGQRLTFMESANIARPLINAKSSTVIATRGLDIDERLIVIGRIVPLEALLQ
jgi:hypothetical protein